MSDWKHNLRSGELAQSLKCLLYKNEDLTLVPRTCRAEKLGNVVHTDNPGSEEAETGGSLEP